MMQTVDDDVCDDLHCRYVDDVCDDLHCRHVDDDVCDHQHCRHVDDADLFTIFLW